MPSKAKSKNVPAHQHDKRHESGLAAPGKRVVRQRSNQHLAGVNGKTTAPTLVSASSTTSTGTDHGHDVLRPPEMARQASSQAVKDVTFEDTGDRDRAYSDASCEGLHCEAMEDQDGYYYHPDRRYGAPARKSTLATISTILTYYPLRDAIAILIILLSLPASVMLVVQTLFASLTFVPPSTGISLPSIKEMFNTSNMGYPALATILFVDLIFYLCWLVVWRPVQGVLLDLSQAVIAVSLSGAAASTGGPTYSIVTCSTLVCIVHLLRYKAIHLTAFDYLRSVLHRLDLSVDLSLPFSASSLFNSTTFTTSQHGWFYTTLRTLLGIHIVSQGVTTCIRRSLANANEKGTHVPSIQRADTEASAGIELVRNGIPSTPDLNSTSTFSEGRSRASSPGRLRESTTKKRKKQANEVRSKQPLWAAIASTKVTFVKEMEQRDAVDDAKEAQTIDRPGYSFVPSAKPQPHRIWMSDMLDTEVVLRLELPVQTVPRDDPADDEAERNAKPFTVRMNGASWNSIRIFEDPDSDGRNVCFTVEIFGLAPLSSYLCEIDDIAEDRPLCSINLITSAARTAAVAPAIPTPAQLQPLRPTSPSSTLRKSIEQATISLAETRNKSRKTKKDQKSAYSDIRREINLLRAKVDNSGGNDDKQARRLQQITQHRNQAEEAAVQLAQQAQEIGELPADEVQAANAAKHQWQIAADNRSAAMRAADSVKADIDREVKDILSDVTAGEQKHEKLAARQSQRKEELVAAIARQAADSSAKQKHMLERTAKREEQEKTETQLRFHIASMTNDAEHWNNKAVDAYTQGQALSNWQTSPPPGYSAPDTPDQLAASLNGQTYAAFPGQYQTHAPRGRSSSMLSQYSGFTDDGDGPGSGPFEPRHQYTWPMAKYGYANGSAVVEDGNAIDGSSGSSGTDDSTASSPRPDARSFVPASKISAIGPPRKEKTASSPHLGNGSVSPVLENGNGHGR